MGLVGDLLEVGKKLAGMINKHVEKTVDQVFGVKNCNIEMDVDRVYSKLYFTDAKKRYVGVCVWQGKPCSFVETKGFEVVRKDWPLVSQMVQEELFNMILDERKLEVVRKYLLNVRKQLFEGLLDDRLTVYKSLGKSVDEYDVEPPHVRCAKEMIKQGINVRVGDKIPFLMVGDGVAKPVLPGQKLNLTRTEYKYVWDKYVNSLVERLKLPVVGDNKRLEEFA